ncbi:methylthioacryloyl-CoA hydratase-like [Pecten maximus]|uniref:methylthioacryloyl-CoA hydratase-like n=1 Tax=Pecten maximus TaxID=6579 RepID=UPI0014584FD7|nr:methylthioacryloyl-CoA hydratase-like [Pecten maximus]
MLRARLAGYISSSMSKISHRFASDIVSNTVRVEVLRDKHVCLIEIVRPEVRNAVDPPTAKALYTAFREFNEDDESNVAVLHGAGGHFCAGYDLKALSTSDGTGIEPPDVSDVGPMGPTRLRLTKPVIAAISGYAVAGGLELALMCDLRVVDQSAVMGVFCRRFGVPLIDGGTVRLPHLIGLSRALDLILTGRPVEAQEALTIGLANRVVPTGTALEAAISLAEDIAQFPQGCMRTDRSSALHNMYTADGLEAALAHEFSNGIKVVQEESIPGATSFAKGVGRHGNFKKTKTDPSSKL